MVIEPEQDVGTLEALVATVSDPDARDYLEQALRCLQIGPLRAWGVFMRTTAIRTIHAAVMAKGSAAVSTAIYAAAEAER
ncbi:MAG: hypothetical protein OES46_16910 [Gammaproteobacteria bacterium]|nr:hypothetical protein [Gammaproteobacteria bacterium]